MTALQEFTEVFRAEHRQVRDLLLELAVAFRERDTQWARALGAAVAASTARLAQGILPHVSDCEGLAIMVETLPPHVVSQILAARSAARDANLDLLTWAATQRVRKP